MRVEEVDEGAFLSARRADPTLRTISFLLFLDLAVAEWGRDQRKGRGRGVT